MTVCTFLIFESDILKSKCLHIQFLVVYTAHGLQESPVMLCHYIFSCISMLSHLCSNVLICRILDIRLKPFLMISFLNGYVFMWCLQVWLCVLTYLWAYMCYACTCQVQKFKIGCFPWFTGAGLLLIW